MVIEIIIPIMYEDMDSAIFTWVKKEGDKIESGDPLFCLETDKANFDVEAEHEGILVQLLAKNNDKVRVLDIVGYIKSN